MFELLFTHAKHVVVVARTEVVVESSVEVVVETRKNFPSRFFSSVWSATPVFFLESQTPQEARAAIIRTKLLCKLITIKILRNVYRCMVNKYGKTFCPSRKLCLDHRKVLLPIKYVYVYVYVLPVFRFCNDYKYFQNGKL